MIPYNESTTKYPIAWEIKSHIMAVGYTQKEAEDACAAEFGWSDIVAISAGNEHTVGLKSDGTVVAVGSNGYGRCDAGDWKGIKLP